MKSAVRLPSRRFPRWPQVLAALAVVVAVLWVGRRIGLDRAWPWIDGLGAWGPVAFCGVYVAATVGMLPASILTLAAGAKWGPWEGLGYVIAASNLAANLAFGLGRFVARSWVTRLVADRPRFAAIDEAVAAEGWKIVALLRLSPVFPFNVLNYALSLTRVRWRDYALASLVGMLPGTAMFVYLGSVVQLAARPQGRSPLEWALFAAGLAATVTATLLVTRAARRALDARLVPVTPEAGKQK
jgi:uncharacterized membrane protein YdjX (TVP38/TMEM64 family)